MRNLHRDYWAGAGFTCLAGSVIPVPQVAWLVTALGFLAFWGYGEWIYHWLNTRGGRRD